jgi:hypothetical protein
MRRSYRVFLTVFFVPIVLAILAGGVNWVFLVNAGELTDVDTVAAIQQTEGGLYGTDIHPNVYVYKFAVQAQRKADVVVLGSSRVLSLRQGLFTAPFTNMGRTVNYPMEADRIVERLLKTHKPDIVLLGIDYWWANGRWPHSLSYLYHFEPGARLTPAGLLAPWRWLADGDIDMAAYWRMVSGATGRLHGGAPMIGYRAIHYGNGFSAEGAYSYYGTAYGRNPAEDPHFADTLARIAADTAQFRYGDAVAPERVEQLRRAVDRLRRAGVAVITFLPPLAPTVYRVVHAPGERFAYVDKARAAFATLNTPHFDFLDPASMGATDCEFVDGFHSGEVVYARMIKAMASAPGSPLARYVNMAVIDAVIEGRAGHALAWETDKSADESEIDYLELGCRKSG